MNINEKKLDKILPIGILITVVFIMISFGMATCYFHGIIRNIILVSSVVVILSMLGLILHLSGFDTIEEINFEPIYSIVSLVFFVVGLLLIIFMIMQGFILI